MVVTNKNLVSYFASLVSSLPLPLPQFTIAITSRPSHPGQRKLLTNFASLGSNHSSTLSSVITPVPLRLVPMAFRELLAGDSQIYAPSVAAAILVHIYSTASSRKFTSQARRWDQTQGLGPHSRLVLLL